MKKYLVWVGAILLALGLTTSSPAQSTPSVFGIEYGYVANSNSVTSPQKAVFFNNVGLSDVKFSDVMWSDIEPSSPFLWFHTYNFSKLDKAVQEWQLRNYNITMVLRCKSAWGTSPDPTTQAQVPPQLGLAVLGADAPPKSSSRMKDWIAFVKAVVERYDGDGSNDMPGLKYGIKNWEVLSEVQTYVYWMGTAAQYVTLLQNSYTAIKEADPSSVVIAAGFNFRDILDDNPSDSTITTRVNSLAEPWRTLTQRGINFSMTQLAAKNYFDVVEYHANSDWYGALRGATYLRQLMSGLGYQKEVWAGDAFSSPKVIYDSTIEWLPYIPSNQVFNFQVAVSDPNNVNYSTAVGWVRSEQAKLTVKKFTVAAANNVKRMMMGFQEDWPVYTQFPYGGLADSTGVARPALLATTLLKNSIGGFTEASTLSSAPTGLNAYQFTVSGNPVVVAWRETASNAYPFTDTVATVSIPWSPALAVVTTIPTLPNTTPPSPLVVSSVSSSVSFPLGDTPVIITIPAGASNTLTPGMYARYNPSYPDRAYKVYLPTGFVSSTPSKVMILNHGGGSYYDGAYRLTCPGGVLTDPKCITALADSENFVIVAPNGTIQDSDTTSRGFNAGGGGSFACIAQTPCQLAVDEVTYFNSLLNDMEALISVDTDRVYAVGMSNGGALAHRLACQLSNRIAAIGTVGGENEYSTGATCSPTRPVPVIDIHGDSDPLWGYNGSVSFWTSPPKPLIGVPSTLSGWASRNGCSPTPTTTNLPVTVSDGTSVIKSTYNGCTADLIHYKVVGGGHTWPQGWQYASSSAIGTTSQQFNANQVIWNFLKQYHK